MGRRPDITTQILTRLDQQDARLARLERLIGRLVAGADKGNGAEQDGEEAVAAQSNDPDDPFVPPDWVQDPKTGVFTYTIETECCQHCGRGFYPEKHWTWRDNEDNTIISFNKNGSKPRKFSDIGPREIRIRRKEYRCVIHSCFGTTRQKLPDIFHEHHRMTKRLYESIVKELKKPVYTGQIKDIAEMAGLSPKTISAIRDEI